MSDSLRYALESSAAFRSLFPQLTIFPLRLIVDGPACTCAKRAACRSIGKHPAILWRDLAAAAKISGEPGCGCGIATGERSGLFVIDLDGWDAIDAFFAMGEVPPTFAVRRGCERVHLYFTWPSWRVKNSASDLGKGIDVRGDGGFVVAPGSPHKSGERYEIVDDVPVAAAPAWLLALDALRKPARTPTSYGEVEPVPLGDLAGDYARRRVNAAAEYLRRAPLSLEGHGGRNVFFRVCLALVRWQRLPIDVAAELVAEIYNPRLRAIGTTEWTEEDMTNRLESARDTASEVPPGDIMDEATWLDLAHTLGSKEIAP